MFKNLCRFFLVLLILSLGGCLAQPPEQKNIFAGKWCEIGNLDSNLQFVDNAVSFNGVLWENVSYKIKRVDKASYLKTKSLSGEEDSALADENVNTIDIVTLYASDNYIGELLKIDDRNLLFLVQDKVLKFEKTSDNADNIAEILANGQIPSDQQNKGISGVLLGIRIPSEENFIYKTLWLSIDSRGLRPFLRSDNLFFPRTSGFWELKVEKDHNFMDVISARNIAVKEDYDDWEDIGKPGKRVDYIGNDYISLETDMSGAKVLRILPVDNLLSESGINITDILGDKGIDLIQGGMNQAAESNGINIHNIIMKDEMIAENFGINREKGHWIFKGRVNYKDDGQNKSIDYDLNTPVPNRIIFYDTLVLSWYKIIDRVPDAIDAFTSPNKDIAIIRTKNRLRVFTINLGQLSKKPLAEILLQENTQIVMSEWATGSYVEDWEQAFLKYGAQAF